MGKIIVRETLILLLGGAVSCLAGFLAGPAGKNASGLLLAILTPIGFCLARAAMVRLDTRRTPAWRQVAAQVVLAAALVALLLFELGVALAAGAPRVPPLLGLVFGVLGLAYVLLFCGAWHLARAGWRRTAASEDGFETNDGLGAGRPLGGDR